MALDLLVSEILGFANGATNRKKENSWNSYSYFIFSQNLFEKENNFFFWKPQTALKDFPWSEFDPLSR